MEDKEGIIAISDPKWDKILLVKESELEGIITYLNSTNTKLSPAMGFQYIQTFSVGIVDQTEYEHDFKQHVLPFQDLIPIGQNINPEKCQKAFTCSRTCIINLIDFSSKPDGKYEHILIFQDVDSKFTILRALPSLDDYEIYNCLIEIFSLIGVPSTILTNAKAKIKPIIEKLNYFCEKFDSKIELPDEKEQGNEIQKFKDLVEEWMTTNNSSEWHIGIYFIQFRHNCDYDPTISVSPFDKFFKPKYEYVKRSFTRYLLHRPKIMETPTINEATDTDYLNQSDSGSIENRLFLPNSNNNEKTKQVKDIRNEFYLLVEPGNNQLDSRLENQESMMHILENTNRYKLSDKNKDPIVQAIDNRHIVLYKMNNYVGVPDTETLVKLEPIDIQKPSNQTNWVCKVREVDFVGNTKFSNKSNNKQEESHDLDSGIPSSNNLESPGKDQVIKEENSLAQTVKNELMDLPLNTSATVCLVCRKRIKNDSQELKFSQIGKPVRLRTSVLDRQKGHPNFILAVIVDVMPNGEYKLGTPKGVLKDGYTSDALMDCNHTLFTLNDIPTTKIIGITEALNGQLKYTEKELMKCTCYRQFGYCNPKFSFHNRCLMNKKNPVRFRLEKRK